MNPIPRVLVLLLGSLLAACGGGGGGGSTDPGPPVVSTPPLPTAGMRAEDSDASVSLAGTWTASDSSWGWSGASAREVDLFARPTDEIHTPIVTISDLAPGQHKLTIEVTGRQSGEAQGNLVVVDAFDVEPQAVSHWQETDPDAKYSAGWFKSSPAYNWSGSGVSNVPELPVTAEETELPGVKVDLYSPTARYQPVVFTATGLADANHTLTITSTGRRNPTSSAARVVVDAFDVTTPGRRHEEYEPRSHMPACGLLTTTHGSGAKGRRRLPTFPVRPPRSRSSAPR